MTVKIANLRIEPLTKKTLVKGTCINIKENQYQEIMEKFKWIVSFDMSFPHDISILNAKIEAMKIYTEIEEFFERSCDSPEGFDFRYVMGGAHVLIRDDSVAALFKLQWNQYDQHG